VTEAATYCVLFSEHQTFAEARASKAMVRFAPGNYPLGTKAGIDVMLPTCIRMRSATQPSITMAAPLSHTKDTFEATDTHHYAWVAPIEGHPHQSALEMQFDIRASLSAAPSMMLDGTENDLEDFSSRHWLRLCADSADCAVGLMLDSCTHDSGTLHTHSVTLEGGEIELSLRIGQSFASTEPGAFIGATGTWQGDAFEQLDYFQLIYVPFHHHFTRSFIVMFDAPIDGACGLRLSDLDPFDLPAGNVATVDCDLKDIASVAITAHTHSAQ